MKKLNEVDQLTAIKDRLSLRVDAAMARWAHRKGGGQSHRSIGAARRQARLALMNMGFTVQQARQILTDLYDLVVLERNADA